MGLMRDIDKLNRTMSYHHAVKRPERRGALRTRWTPVDGAAAG